MDSHPWFQQLRDALKKAGVIKKYSDRLVSELWFHYLDMKEQNAMSDGPHSKTSDELERLVDQTIAFGGA